MLDKLGVPVATYWNSVDLIEDAHPLYVGRGGNMGDRAGNFAVQNADLVLAIGTRISIRQTGYNFCHLGARRQGHHGGHRPGRDEKAHHPCGHARLGRRPKDFLQKPGRRAGCRRRSAGRPLVCRPRMAVPPAKTGRKTYPVTLPRHWAEDDGYCNVFAFMRYMSEQLPENSLTAVSNGACCVVGHQDYCIKRGTRFIINSAIASMGYGLPAAVGLCIAGGRRDTVCLEGDGSIMMNLQELQTIVTNRLPIKIFLINNQGYHSIRITQNNLFKDHCKVGVGPESGDLSFPEVPQDRRGFRLPLFFGSLQ